jgi:hypothetical protein
MAAERTQVSGTSLILEVTVNYRKQNKQFEARVVGLQFHEQYCSLIIAVTVNLFKELF